MDFAQLPDADERALEEGPERRIVLHGVSWKQYEDLLASLGDTGSVRLAYFEGALEIMSPSGWHETVKSMIARLLEMYAFERDVPLCAFGSTTFRKRGQRRGVEPDECYILSEEGVRDPAAPDLAIEVVLSAWQLDKFGLYAGLGVKELWLVGKQGIAVHVLRAGRYRRSARSRLLPDLDLALLLRFAGRDDQPRAVREYRDAVRRPPATR